MSTLSFTITIPIRPHLKKMIARTKSTDPFIISKGKCHYSHALYNALRSNVSRHILKHPDALSEVLPIYINNTLFKDGRYVVDDRMVNNIDCVLQSMFEDKLFTYLDDNAEGKGDIKEYIEKFRDNYGLTEEEAKYDTLKKMYYRYRQDNPINDARNFRQLAKTP